ncbi:hypothetical protein [Chromobacterium phragmitis]|uniref:Uncharacterized protein n=1 Tax=Chromobacterium phragmitis TaxID=2202141 RepID=A0A344UPK0_9NEIS|nr:hypothetical protein [Chromobacterium phragmitis]AXE37198.1 hypothetical protein DK843_22885 [Chromobacterium phragmitis]
MSIGSRKATGWSIRYRCSGWTVFGPNLMRGGNFVKPYASGLPSAAKARAMFEALWPHYRP